MRQPTGVNWERVRNTVLGVILLGLFLFASSLD